MVRRSGYRNFIRKVEGNDNIHSTASTGGWLFTRHRILFELGTGIIGWSRYVHWHERLSYSERLALNTERKRLGIRVGFNCPMGNDIPLRIEYNPTSEPLDSDPVGERQGNESGCVFRGRVIPYDPPEWAATAFFNDVADSESTTS